MESTIKDNRIANSLYTKFGDLAHPESVVMRKGEWDFNFPSVNPFTVHLTVTGKCQARCKGCINASVTLGPSCNNGEELLIKDTHPERDARCILKLIEKQDGRDVVVCFYGGEPLLAMDKMEEVVRILRREAPLERIRFMLYTNGDLLHRLIEQYPQLTEEIWLFSVSIDGTKKQHEQFRIGTHLDRIHENLEKLKSIRRGKVLMWSTIRENQSLGNCFEEYSILNDQGLVDLFFWHWLESSEPFRNFSAFSKSYVEDLDAIMKKWVAALNEGIILPVTHLSELVLFLLTGKERGTSACGVELEDNYDLMNGKIHACVDLPIQMAIGEVNENGMPLFHPHNLKDLVKYKESLECNVCGIHAYCGGRCPVQAHCSGDERLRQYCKLMRLHVGTVQKYSADIQNIFQQGRVSLDELYWKSAYFAQFTDVTP